MHVNCDGAQHGNAGALIGLRNLGLWGQPLHWHLAMISPGHAAPLAALFGRIARVRGRKRSLVVAQPASQKIEPVVRPDSRVTSRAAPASAGRWEAPASPLFFRGSQALRRCQGLVSPLSRCLRAIPQRNSSFKCLPMGHGRADAVGMGLSSSSSAAQQWRLLPRYARVDALAEGSNEHVAVVALDLKTLIGVDEQRHGGIGLEDRAPELSAISWQLAWQSCAPRNPRQKPS